MSLGKMFVDRPRASIRGTFNRNGGLTRMSGTVGMLEDDFRDRQIPFFTPAPNTPNFIPTAGRGAAPNLVPLQQPVQPASPSGLPTPPPTLMESLGSLDPSLYSGLSAMGASLLQSSGYSPVPRTTGQVFGDAMQAFTAAQQQSKRQAVQDQIALTNLQIKRAGAGMPFQGTSMQAQDRNTVLSLSEKVKNNEASSSEISAYRMALSNLTQPKEVKSFGENGEVIVTQVPPTDVGGVFIPEDMKRETQKSTKPTALMQKQRARLPKLQSAAGLINKYRRALLDAKESGLYEGFAGVGQYGQAIFPSKEMVDLKNDVTEIRLSIKDMEELGALVGGDFAILDALVLDPDSPTALRLGADVLLTQLDNLEERLVERISAAQELSGFEGDNLLNFQGTFRSPYQSVTKDQLAKLPPNSYFIAKDDPTNKVRFKGAM